jgi:hypothetical protein
MMALFRLTVKGIRCTRVGYLQHEWSFSYTLALSVQIATDLLENRPAVNARLPTNARGYGTGPRQ